MIERVVPALLILVAVACSLDDERTGASCTPTARGFGAMCSRSIACPKEAPICVTRTHEEQYGFCTRACVDLFDCVSDAGVTGCSIYVVEIPGIDGGVMACAFDCAGCPGGLSCANGADHCVPSQDADVPDGAPVCSDPTPAGAD